MYLMSTSPFAVLVSVQGRSGGLAVDQTALWLDSHTVHTYSQFLPQQMVVVDKVLQLSGSKFLIFSMVIVRLLLKGHFKEQHS